MGAACGGVGFAALTAAGLATATGITAWSFAFGVTEKTDNGKDIAGAGNRGTDNDNEGEFAGRPEFRRGDGEAAVKPMDGPNGLTDNAVVRAT